MTAKAPRGLAWQGGAGTYWTQMGPDRRAFAVREGRRWLGRLELGDRTVLETCAAPDLAGVKRWAERKARARAWLP